MRRSVALLTASALLAFGAALAPPVRAADPATVTIYSAYTSSGSSEAAAFAEALARVQTLYPDITIVPIDVPFGILFSEYLGSAETGVPDLMVAPNDSLYWEWQTAYALDVRSAISSRLASLRHEALVGSTVDGALAQVPESLKSIALYYNRDLIRHAPTTTAGTMAALKAGTKIGIVGLGADVYYSYGFFGSFGGRIMDRGGTCIADRNEGVAQALTWLHRALATGNFIEFGSWQDAGAAFENGDIAALFEGSWRYADLKATFGDRLGVVAGPTGPQGDLFRSMVGVDGYTVNPFGDTEAALTVARALTDRISQETFMDVGGHIPADRSIRVTDPLLRVFEKAAQDGVLRPMQAELDNYWGTFGDAFSRVVYGDEDATTVVSEDCALMNEANGM